MRKSKNGMTLIEIIVALAILGIIAVSFLAVFTSAFKFIYTAGRKSVAVNQAEQSIESKLAVGSVSNASSIVLDFGTTSVQVYGELVSQIQAYENGSKDVSLLSFIPVNSIVSGSPTTTYENLLELSANELSLRPGNTALLETNKEATFVSSNTGVATITSEGLITAFAEGTTTITVTPTSLTYPGDFQTCVITVSTDLLITDIKGGEYLQYNGIIYQKLTGKNGRVLKLDLESGIHLWSTANDMPTAEELVDGVWTNALRKRDFDYWTYTSKIGKNSNFLDVTYIESDGAFAIKQDVKVTGDTSSMRLLLATSLNVDLKRQSGSGSLGDPYILILPTP